MGVEVIYNGDANRTQWKVHSNGVVVSGHETKDEAREAAKKEARRVGAASVVVHHKSGGNRSVSAR